ncbi:MAG TPA: hypothetical protein VHQ20_02020 [Patescibacteria group bacterium]|jgi:hypothetical protein|nr:hypothetical protein [Patescibacteria group bacterium]
MSLHDRPKATHGEISDTFFDVSEKSEKEKTIFVNGIGIRGNQIFRIGFSVGLVLIAVIAIFYSTR